MSVGSFLEESLDSCTAKRFERRAGDIRTSGSSPSLHKRHNNPIKSLVNSEVIIISKSNSIGQTIIGILATNMRLLF